MSFTEPIKQTKETQKLYDHLQWLSKNPTLMDQIHHTRMQVVMRLGSPWAKRWAAASTARCLQRAWSAFKTRRKAL